MLVSLGTVLTSFMISLSLSPTTANPVRTFKDIPKDVGAAKFSAHTRTCSAVVPVHSDGSLERTLVRLELPKCITGAGGILDNATGVGWPKVFQNAVHLVLRRSTLLNLCSQLSASISFPAQSPSPRGALSIDACAGVRTKIEVGSFQLALLGVIARLVLGRMRNGSGVDLLQQGVYSGRDWVRGSVEESDDILDTRLRSS